MANIATEKNQEAGERAMFRAAFDSFHKEGKLLTGEALNVTARRVVAAMAAAGMEKQRIEKEAGTHDRPDYFSLYSNPADVVASAFWCLANDVPYSDDLAPCSVVGQSYIAFAKGIAAAMLASDALTMLSDAESSFNCADDGAFMLSIRANA